MESNNVTQHHAKIQQLLGKFLEPDFEIKNDTYLSRLLTHFSGQEKPEVDASVISVPVFSEWLLRAVALWEASGAAPAANIASFTLNLAGLLSRDESAFRCLNASNFYTRLLHVAGARRPEAAPSVKLGYVKLLGSLLEHEPGIRWVVASSLWEDVLRLSLSNQTVYIAREGRGFMSRVLQQTIDLDEAVCHNIIKQIMLPLDDTAFKSITTAEVSDELIHQSISSTLQLLGDVLEYFLESVLFAQNDCRIVSIFLRDFHLEQKICNFMMIAQNKYLIFDLGKIMFIMQFLEIYVCVIGCSVKVADLKVSVRKLMSIFSTNISKGNFENVMKFCYHGQLYWNLVGFKVPCIKFNKDNEPISFANQLLVLQLLPIFAIAMKHRRCYNSDEIYADEFRDEYVQKLFKMMCEITVRVAYNWRDFLVAQPNLFEIATKGLIYVMKTRKYYPRERAAIAFQSFVYALKDVMCSIKEAPEKLNMYAQEVNFFSLLFDAFVVFIEEFQITWRDSVETICVMAISYDFLSVPTWPSKLVIKALKLVNVSITKYMSPNLALLVDRTNDSVMAGLGQLLFTKLHDASWEVRDSALEVVCTISHMSNTKVKSSLITLPIFTEWITRAVATWYSNRVTPATNIAAFTMNLASLLSISEERFCVLNNNNFFIKLVNVLKARQVEAAPSIKLAYIKLMSSFLEHKSGVEWMMACSFWEDIFRLSLSEQTPSIAEESHKFMAKVLEQTIDHDEIFCNNVAKRVMAPLAEYIKAIPASQVPETDELNLSRCLHLMGNTLEYFLEGILFDQKDFRVLFIFMKNFHLKERIAGLMAIAKNEKLAFDLEKIMFIMQFLELYVTVLDGNLTNVKASLQKIREIFISKFSKKDFCNYVKLCKFGHLFWNLLGRKIPTDPTDAKNESVSFAAQLAHLQTFPSWCLIIKYCYPLAEMEEFYEAEEFRNIYITHLINAMCHDVMRIAYIWRDYLTSHPDLFEFCTMCLSSLLECRKYYPREHAVLVFQTVLYILKDLIMAVQEFPEKNLVCSLGARYFPLMFEILGIFIEEFKITWKDCYETVDVMATSFDFLTLPNLPPDMVIKALKLVNISVAKYMCPNMALLVDRTSDSTIALLGPLLYLKLHDSVSEVKKCALEIIYTMSRMSSNKFPSLQKVLMDSELPALVVKMSTCDGESFVRATAIKCLQEMIQVEEIWENALNTENLSEKMREILLNETEGIVRVEAATFMCIAYEHQQFPKESLDRIYETMIHSSTTDLHWEVKVRALGFWDKVIKNHLQNQGMIDGTFPNVTFSKEHRKIVTLTDSEIRKRLQKVLSQLSGIGCLGVLVTAIKDDCDMEVSKTAVKVTQRLVELFKKYKIYDTSAPISPLPNENGLSYSPSVSSGISVDEAMDSPRYHTDFNEDILDQIVNSKDVSLLKNVYSPSDYGSVCNYDLQVRKVITPSEFLQYTQQDLNNIITEKKNWLNGIEDLGSLLDDMLKTYDDDINKMDCY